MGVVGGWEEALGKGVGKRGYGEWRSVKSTRRSDACKGVNPDVPKNGRSFIGFDSSDIFLHHIEVLWRVERPRYLGSAFSSSNSARRLRSAAFSSSTESLAVSSTTRS